MTNKLCYLVCILLAVACKRDVDKDSHDENCIAFAQKANWTETEFRTNYTIQFPQSYLVEKSQGYEGVIYQVKRADNSVRLEYIYCSSMDCYGSTGLSSLPEFVNFNLSSGTIQLDQKAGFCSGNEQPAVLYYKKGKESHAVLYWKEDNKHKKALEITYDEFWHQEVLDIVKTIKAK